MAEIVLFKYLFVAVLSSGTATIGCYLAGRKTLVYAARFFLLLFGIGLFVAIDAVFLEPNWIEVHPVPIQDPQLSSIVGDTKILQITDIHLRNGLGFLEKQLIKKVNALKPDLIFITGDFIDREDQIPSAVELIRSLKAGLGIFGVPGNTDHIVMNSRALRDLLAPSGIDILINENRLLRLPTGRTLQLVGIDDPKYGYDKFGSALRGTTVRAPVVLLAHSPKIFEDAVREKINLVLVGDTHGGQVGIPLLIRFSEYANRTPYMKGLFKKGQTQMYVNRGIGIKTLPIRFLCRPEIAVLEIKA